MTFSPSLTPTGWRTERRSDSARRSEGDTMIIRLGRVVACLALALASARCADSIIAPVANAGTAVTVNMGSSVALDGRSSTDPQGRSLAYDWSITARPVLSQTSLNDAHIATPSFIPDLDGSYTIGLVVSNGVLSSPASQVIVTARKCSQAAPDITAAVAAPANPNTGNTVQLSATVHDADNDPACNLNQTFTLLWTAVALSDPAATSPTFVPDQIGTYQFSVATTENWYVPIWSGTKVGLVAAGSESATAVQSSVKVWFRLQAGSLSASCTVAESWTVLPVFGFAGAATAAVMSGAAWLHLRAVTVTLLGGLESTPFETTSSMV